jgi:prolipoprotein diacylglyceryltransferase
MIAGNIWLGLGLMFFIFAVSALSFIFWIFMLVNCAKRNFKNDNDRIVWLLIIILLGIIGAIVYYFAVESNPEYNKKSGRKRK